jgi:hypothetical protein
MHNDVPAITILPSTPLPRDFHYCWKSRGPQTFRLEPCSCPNPTVATLEEIPPPTQPHYMWWGAREDIRGPCHCNQWHNAEVYSSGWGEAPDSNVSLLEELCHPDVDTRTFPLPDDGEESLPPAMTEEHD